MNNKDLQDIILTLNNNNKLSKEYLKNPIFTIDFRRELIENLKLTTKVKQSKGNDVQTSLDGKFECLHRQILQLKMIININKKLENDIYDYEASLLNQINLTRKFILILIAQIPLKNYEMVEKYLNLAENFIDVKSLEDYNE